MREMEAVAARLRMLQRKASFVATVQVRALRLSPALLSMEQVRL